MNKLNTIKLVVLAWVFVFTPVNAEVENELNIYQVMQRVLDKYPSLKISEFKVAQAAEQKQQVESSLGWIINSAAGVKHDLTGYGTPSDRFDMNSSIARKLKSGATLSLNGSYRYEDSSFTIGPLPNPSNNTRLDLSYRMPLAQGEGNPLYSENLVVADAGHDLAKANLLLTRITLAEKVKDLFYASALTQARLNNELKSVGRAKKLEAYISKNVELGLSEKKDLLQARAQLHSKIANFSSIQIQWEQQENSLNRLMLEEWGKKLNPRLTSTKMTKNYNVVALINETKKYHPAVEIAKANLKIAESKLSLEQNSKKDNLDLVVSVGSRTTDGSSATLGTISQLDWAGAVSIEYKHIFDDKGLSSKYKQAQLEKHIALQNIDKTNDDIRYTVSGLVAEIEAAKNAVKTAQQKLKSEHLKLKEVEYRFKNGRANTAQLIQFQNEYSFAQLAYENQVVDLNNRFVALQIFTGQFWNKLNMKNVQHGAD